MKKEVTNRAASVRARLLRLHRESGGTFDFLLRRYAAERFLYRLGESPYREQFVLKGGALLAVWGDAVYRPTRDIDFTGYGESTEPSVLGKIRRICQASVPDDGLVFDSESLVAGPIRDDSEYDGLRIELRARLETAVIPMRIDIGFGNHVAPAPEEVDYPTLIDLPSPRIRAYPMEAVVAEKLHAMVTHGERNSRYKDFYDVFTLADLFAFSSRPLIDAIGGTFGQRGTPIEGTPSCLMPDFYTDGDRSATWRTYRTRNALPGASEDFTVVGERMTAFLVPVWSSIDAGQAFDEVWPPGGPWSEGRS